MKMKKYIITLIVTAVLFTLAAPVVIYAQPMPDKTLGQKQRDREQAVLDQQRKEIQKQQDDLKKREDDLAKRGGTLEELKQARIDLDKLIEDQKKANEKTEENLKQLQANLDLRRGEADIKDAELQRRLAEEQQRLTQYAVDLQKLRDEQAEFAKEQAMLIQEKLKLKQDKETFDKETKERDAMQKQRRKLDFENKTGDPAQLHIMATGAEGQGATQVDSKMLEAGRTDTPILATKGLNFGREGSEYWIGIKDKGGNLKESNKLKFKWQGDGYAQPVTIGGEQFQLSIELDEDFINMTLKKL